jgi:hypothetical protein
MRGLRKIHWKRVVLVLGLAVSLALIGIFSIRTVSNLPRARVDEPIRPWMNVPYIAHSYHVAAHLLYQALGLPSTRPFDRRPIMDIARSQQRPIQEVIDLLQAAIREARLASPPPPTPSPTPAPPTP